MSDRTATVRARKLRKVYGTGGAEVAALRDVDLDIEANRLTAIMGPSGLGQVHAHAPARGPRHADVRAVLSTNSTSLALDDRRLTALRRTEIGFVFQSFNLVPTLTALENILLPFELGGAKPDRAHGWNDGARQTGPRRRAAITDRRAVRRPAAAGRDRTRARDPPR